MTFLTSFIVGAGIAVYLVWVFSRTNLRAAIVMAIVWYLFYEVVTKLGVSSEFLVFMTIAMGTVHLAILKSGPEDWPKDVQTIKNWISHNAPR